MQCACESIFELAGNEAEQYAGEHLNELTVDVVVWTVTYQCPSTDRRWVRDSPQSELHGGGPPRLRQIGEDGLPIASRDSKDPFR
jgi:hypothetical protein